LLGRQP